MIAKKFKELGGGTIFIGATFISQVFNFFFNTYLGRSLSFEDYALITVVINIWYFILIILNALSFVITNRVAYLEKNETISEVGAFYRFFTGKTIQISLLGSALWLLLTPLVLYFFHISSWLAILMIAPSLFIGAIMSISRGFMQGRTIFIPLSISIIFESVVRMGVAILFVTMGFPSLTYLSIPISLGLTVLINYMLERKHIPPTTKEHIFTFPTSLFIALLLIGLSNTVFLTVDILMVKHYFDDRTAGVYALLGLVGKIVFFFSALLSGVLFTYASQGKKTGHTFFYRILLSTCVLAIIAFVAFGIVGRFTTALLIGEKSSAIVPYLLPYAGAISLFAITNTFITYHIARGLRQTAYIALLLAIALIGAISIFHENIFDIVYAVLWVSIVGFIISVGFHFYAVKWGYTSKEDE